MAGDLGGYEWVGVVLTSAVVSTVLNVAWGVVSKAWDSKLKSDEVKVRRRLVYQDLSMLLASFARESSTYIDRVADAIYHRGEETAESRTDPMPPAFPAIEHIDWSLLPIRTVDSLKGIRERYETARVWMSEQWILWADVDDMLDFERQRSAFYGREALIWARKSRIEADLDEGDFASMSNIELALKQWSDNYQKDDGTYLLPELADMFDQVSSDKSKTKGEKGV